MEVLIKILQLLLSLSLLVFIHELGHFAAARIFGIRVEKFYMFFDIGGFSLFKFKRGDTTYGVGWLPLGGYVKISGMIDESMDTEAMKQPPKPWEFRSKPAWQRLIVMVAGVLMNVIAACLIYIGMSWHWGDSYIDNSDLQWGWQFNGLAHEIGFQNGDKIIDLDGKPATGDYRTVFADIALNQVRSVTVNRHGQTVTVDIPEKYTADLLKSEDFMEPRLPFTLDVVVPDEGAHKAGMVAGDSLVSFNGVPMVFFDQFQSALKDSKGQTAQIGIIRNADGVATPMMLNVAISDEGQLGVRRYSNAIIKFVPVRHVKYNFWQAVPSGFRKAGAQISSYWNNLKLLVKPKTEAYKQVGSLITIGNIFPGQWDWHSFWSITAFISIILAVMNILPIPLLDGGHVLFLLWEVITGRKPSDKFMEWAMNIGMILLFALLIFAFGNDIYRFFIK